MKNRMKELTLLVAVLFAGGALSADWRVQPESSKIGFTAFSRMHDVEGLFKEWAFSGRIRNNWTGQGKIVIKTASIDTENAKRDAHLKNEDFFNVSKHPEAVFTIEKAEVKGNRLNISGKLTMLGVTKPVSFQLERKVSGNTAVLSGETKINRKDFGMDYDSFMNPIEDEVKVTFKISLKKI